MPKKTRKEKMLADKHRFVYSLEKPAASYSFVKPTSIPILDTSGFLKQDIKKTLILGMSFILSEFILAYVTKNFGW